MHVPFPLDRPWNMVFAATLVLGGILVGWPPPLALAAETDPLDVLSRIERQGADNEAASAAWRRLLQGGPEQLPQLLAALDNATPLGANWIRAAIDAIAERALARGDKLPIDKLEAFVNDTTHAPERADWPTNGSPGLTRGRRTG